MKKPAGNHNPQEENPYGLIGKMYEGAKKDHQAKILSIYVGGALIIAFLFLASLAPQVGERLGNLAVKKQTQESRAAVFDTGTMTFSANLSTIAPGQSAQLNWNAPQADRYFRCTASGSADWKGPKNLSGNQQVTPTQTTTYNLACTRKQKRPTSTATDVRKVKVTIGVTSSVFESNEKPPPCTVPGQTGSNNGYGDVDGNGKVNNDDSQLILEYVAKLPRGDAIKQGQREKNADLNRDGKINSADALLIQRYLGGYIKTFIAVCGREIPPPR